MKLSPLLLAAAIGYLGAVTTGIGCTEKARNRMALKQEPANLPPDIEASIRAAETDVDRARTHRVRAQDLLASGQGTAQDVLDAQADERRAEDRLAQVYWEASPELAAEAQNRPVPAPGPAARTEAAQAAAQQYLRDNNLKWGQPVIVTSAGESVYLAYKRPAKVGVSSDGEGAWSLVVRPGGRVERLGANATPTTGPTF